VAGFAVVFGVNSAGCVYPTIFGAVLRGIGSLPTMTAGWRTNYVKWAISNVWALPRTPRR
jgi:hypothetical protein